MPIAQRSGVWLPFLSSVDLTVRSRWTGGSDLQGNVARTVESVNPDLSLAVHPLSDYISDSLVQERLIALLAGGFAVLALVLAAVGLYGVTAHAIARPRTEIAIRIALGATTANIVRLTVSRLGTLIALGATTGVLALTAMLAAWTPVRRAVRTTPASSLRCT